MTYNALPNHLWATADVVRRYLSQVRGLTGIQVESPIDNDIEYRPTFIATTRDYHILCVDVSENIYNPTRWHFISDCKSKGMPVKLYVSLPTILYSGFAVDLKEARQSDVGIYEVSTGSGNCQELNTPLSLSLTGLRNFDVSVFPKKYREPVSLATHLFKNGDPNKACSNVYDEIEALTRKIAIKSYGAGKWQKHLRQPSRLEAKMAWAQLIVHLRDDLDRTSSPYSVLSDTLISRIHGITSLRNDSGHKLRNKKDLMKRDAQLRTRMESAVDLLQELTNVIKGLRI